MPVQLERRKSDSAGASAKLFGKARVPRLGIGLTQGVS